MAVPDRARPHVLVTGGLGFIGSTLSHHLVDSGHAVTVADIGDEDRHRRAAAGLGGVTLRRIDLGADDLRPLLGGVGLVVHLAGRPGVQTSWGTGFEGHLAGNVHVTQRILEAALDVGVERIVVASSSSVYGSIPAGRATEAAAIAPLSPYGVAKAAVEMLVGAYAARGVPAVALRYFTVYGRRQRPDMALSRMIEAAVGGPAFPLRGAGHQVRDLTHVDDVARATIAALRADLAPGQVCNVGSGSPISLRTMLDQVSEGLGLPVPVEPVPDAPGDPGRTAADGDLARRLLGWSPTVAFADGLADQIRHHRSTRAPLAAPQP